MVFAKVLRSVAVALILALGVGAAQDFDAGLAAAQAGDFSAALQEWVPLAEQGNAEAQLLLGVMFDKGQGVPQDDAEEVKWYRLAAEQGNALAQVNLGYVYDSGQGVPQDFVTAHMWFNVASASGQSAELHKDASDSRERVAAKMSSADISEAQRRARICFESGFQDCD